MTKVAVVDIGRTVVSVVKTAYTIGTCKTTATRPAATANVSEHCVVINKFLGYTDCFCGMLKSYLGIYTSQNFLLITG